MTKISPSQRGQRSRFLKNTKFLSSILLNLFFKIIFIKNIKTENYEDTLNAHVFICFQIQHKIHKYTFIHYQFLNI